MKSIILGICIALSVAVVPESIVAVCFALEQPRKFDEFGNVTCEDELARLDNFTNELLNDANAQGHLIVYGGQRGRRNEARARAARMKFYLVRNRGLDTKRIITLDGGYREELTTELWVMRRGESPPLPTPSVNPRDVKLRGRVRVRGYYCGEGLG